MNMGDGELRKQATIRYFYSMTTYVSIYNYIRKSANGELRYKYIMRMQCEGEKNLVKYVWVSIIGKVFPPHYMQKQRTYIRFINDLLTLVRGIQLCYFIFLFWSLFCMECVQKGTFKLSFVGRLSSFGGYFVWSVYRRELLNNYCPSQRGCPLSECPLSEVSLYIVMQLHI